MNETDLRPLISFLENEVSTTELADELDNVLLIFGVKCIEDPTLHTREISTQYSLLHTLISKLRKCK